MTEEEFRMELGNNMALECEFYIGDIKVTPVEVVQTMNNLLKENNELKKDLKDCKKLKGKRLNKLRNHRAVIEDLGGNIRAYKGQISQLNNTIEKIKETMEETGALTPSQLKEILK